MVREPGSTDQESSSAADEQGKGAVEKPSPVAKPNPAASEQWEEMAEKPGPEAEQSPQAKTSPAVAESIPWQLPTEPHKPKPQEDAGDHIALPSKAGEEDLDSDKEELVVREPASTAATPARDKYSSLI
ncbi:hypothetical protein AAES_117556 [Amazona aestiva]|uniref:Uncharacterized protein n=1 Tax=Amazona aestiva TaxID=12930 RepID=A0A0Q3M6E5_AMAAE|nr:hypothetical protein AAES_117556 [Amazona aestiva]